MANDQLRNMIRGGARRKIRGQGAGIPARKKDNLIDCLSP